MHDLLNMRYRYSVLPTPTGLAGGPVDFNATGDKFILESAVPIDVYRFGIVTIELMDPDAGGFVLALDHRPNAGSDTNRVQVEVLTRADAETVPTGHVVYREVVLPVAQTTGSDGSLVDVEPAGPFRMLPGEEMVLEVTNAVGAASTGYVWIEFAELAFQDTVANHMTKDST